MATLNLGGLYVTFGSDNAPLERGSEKAKKTIKDVEKTSTITFARVAAAARAAALAMAAAFAAAGYAIKKSLDAQGNLDKFSQQIGVTTEALSRLEYAAGTVGVNLEGLKGALTSLGAGLQETAITGAGTAAAAFQAIGVSATDASGKVKASQEVLLEVANRFATMENSANKTALAVALFGDAGADLLPLLNKGAAGIAELEAKADALGVTLSDTGAVAATKFNKTLGEIYNSTAAIVGQAVQQILPVLQQLADAYLENSSAQETVKATVDGLVVAMKVVIDVFSRAYAVVRNLTTAILSVGSAIYQFSRGEFTKGVVTINEGIETIRTRMLETQKFSEQLWSGWTAAVTEAGDATLRVGDALAKQAPSLQAALKAMEDAKTARAEADAAAQKIRDEASAADTARAEQAFTEAEAIRNAYLTPLEAMDLQLKKLEELRAAGALTAQEVASAQVRAALTMADGYLTAAGQIAGALTQLFGKNKAFAIAQAVINTAQGVTAALAASPPPLNFAAAAAVAAAGFAQVQAIRTAQPGGGATAPAPSAGASGGGNNNSGSGSGNNQTLYVEGINRNALFSGDAVRDLATRLIEYQKDGGRVVLGAA